MPLTPQGIDVDHASLDNKLVKLEINVTGDSSTDPSYFPTGTTRSDFDAFSVVTVGACLLILTSPLSCDMILLPAKCCTV